MNTPAHLIFATAAFAKPSQRGTYSAALIGGLLPDISLYLLFAWHRWVLDIPAEIIFRELYYSPTWQQIFAIDNSIPLWSIALLIALILKAPRAIVLSASALLHVVMDFFLHNDDARQQLWPLSDWVFISPVSYWDGDHYGHIVGPIEATLCLMLSIIICMRYRHWLHRITTIALLLLQIAPFIVFALMF